jgi:hypothetical protein
MKNAICVAVCCTIGSAVAQGGVPRDALGFEFGKPLALPTCKVTSTSGAITFYASATAHPCLQPGGLKPGGPAAPRAGFIHFPASERPDIASSERIGYQLDASGNLALLVIGTSGHASQERVLQALVTKYGQPSIRAAVPMQNAIGAKFDSIRATWSDGTLDVAFVGVGGSIDSGSVVIGTPAAHAERAARLQELGSAGRKL